MAGTRRRSRISSSSDNTKAPSSLSRVAQDAADDGGGGGGGADRNVEAAGRRDLDADANTPTNMDNADNNSNNKRNRDDAAAIALRAEQGSSRRSSLSLSSSHNNVHREQQPHLRQEEKKDDGERAGSTAVSLQSRTTRGFCKNCGDEVGEFFNSWHQITTTYYLPALLGSYQGSRLTPRSSTKFAKEQTALEGCTIQPLACPGCFDILAFTAVDAPGPARALFRDRDFFKLPRINLKCESADGTLTVVHPNVVPSPPSLQRMAVGIHLDENKKPSVAPSDRDMEVETARPSHAYKPPHQHSPPLHALSEPAVHAPSHQSSQHSQQHSHQPLHQQHHAPLQPIELNKQPSAPPPALSPSATPLQSHGPPQKSPSHHSLPSPMQKPIQDSPRASHPPAPEPSMPSINRSRELPAPAVNSPVLVHRSDSQTYLRAPQEVQLDAIERLQTQISHNSCALSVQSRDLRRLEEGIPQQENALRHEIRNQILIQSSEIKRVDVAIDSLRREMMAMKVYMDKFVEEVRTELQARPANSVPVGSGGHAHDSALELMANNLASVSHKANEVDTIKVQMEILKHKLQRMEEAAASTPVPAQPAPVYSPRDTAPHSAHSSHPTPNYHTPASVPHINTPVHPGHRAASFTNPATPEVKQVVEPAPPQSGWVPVNSGVKRPHLNGIDTHGEPLGQSIDSVKRPKLAPIEPRVAFTPQAPIHQQQALYDHHMDVDDVESRGQAQPHSGESVANSPAVPPAFIPYPTQEPQEDSWRSEPQRVEYRPTRGRGRGGGRGGRPRKSLQPEGEIGTTPEWETEEWHSVANSQTGADSYYSPVPRSRAVVRRGSGGAGAASRAGRPTSSSGRPMSLGLQGVTAGPGVGMLNDPYAHTKKTRTKPTRNADGILIRKDGRPDMRSQSSAANLRKVHARKEEQKATTGSSPYPSTPLAHTVVQSPQSGAATPSPTTAAATGHFKTEASSEANATTVSAQQQKHERIMNKMFPHGVEASRERHDYAKQVFDAGQTASTRSTGRPRNTVQETVERQHQQQEQHADVRTDSHSPQHHDGEEEREGSGEHLERDTRSPTSGASEGEGREDQDMATADGGADDHDTRKEG